MSESFHLNKNQIDVLNGYLDSGNYPAAYRYLRDIAYSLALNAHAIGNYASASELLKMANWLDYAASINANDGSFVSDMVRGATIWQGNVAGLDAKESLNNSP